PALACEIFWLSNRGVASACRPRALRGHRRRIPAPVGLRVVHKILQLLARLEKRNLLCRYFHLLSGFWIPPDSPPPLPRPKTAKPAYLDFLALLQSSDDALENRFHHRFRFRALQFGDSLDVADEVSLCQCRLFGHRPVASPPRAKTHAPKRSVPQPSPLRW